MPLIRRFCAICGFSSVAHHVFAGVSSVLTLPILHTSKKSKSPRKADKIPALIITIYFFVTLRISGEDVELDDYSRRRDLAVTSMNTIDTARSERGTTESGDVDTWMVEFKEKKWTSLDWYENIEEGFGLDEGTPEGNNHNDPDANEDYDHGDLATIQTRSDQADKHTLYPGLGMMARLPMALYPTIS